jgi:hypothetical protein
MEKSLQSLAVALRWLAGLWIVGWTLYSTLWDDSRLSSMEGMVRGLATLLIPAVVALSFSWRLARSRKPVQTSTATSVSRILERFERKQG